MARIRTIKPEFFTSEDIVSLTPFARLLYIALWCEADRDGRMTWKPRTFKMRYLPADSVDIDALCAELTAAGLIVLYGDGYAHVPSFADHQHLNPRETESKLPDPDAYPTRTPRVSAGHSRASDAQGGREGNVIYGMEDASASDASTPAPADAKSARSRKSGMPADFEPNETGMRVAHEAGIDLKAELRSFADHHRAKGSVMADWQAAWRTWVSRSVEFGRGGKKPAAQTGDWWHPTGFANAHEAANEGCHPHNASQFREGRRIGQDATADATARPLDGSRKPNHLPPQGVVADNARKPVETA